MVVHSNLIKIRQNTGYLLEHIYHVESCYLVSLSSDLTCLVKKYLCCPLEVHTILPYVWISYIFFQANYWWEKVLKKTVENTFCNHSSGINKDTASCTEYSRFEVQVFAKVSLIADFSEMNAFLVACLMASDISRSTFEK